MVLLRHLLGDVLRRLRLRQGRTLREVSAAARVSLGYLSEVERGQKEASSELLAAICTALGTPLSHVLGEVSDSFALAELQNEPVLAGVGEYAAGRPAERGLDTPSVIWTLRWPRRSAQLASRGCVCRLGGREAWTRNRYCVLSGWTPGHPAFDEVARRVRDATDMVPV